MGDEARILPQAQFETEDFTVLLLDEGPDRQSIEPAELQRLLNEHLGWMMALTGSGELLAAGALLDSAPPGGRVTGLGFSRLDSERLAARALLDPAVQAGVEHLRVMAWRTVTGSVSFASELARNKLQSRRLYEEVFGRGNLAAADEIMAAAVVSHGAGAAPTTGTDQIKAQATRLRNAIPDLATILRRQVAEGDVVTSHWSGTGTHTGEMTSPGGTVPPTGNRIEFDEIRIDRFDAGRIVESWFIPDRSTLWSQMRIGAVSAR